MHAQDLLHKYLTFFQKKGHVVIPSASLIPVNDASVLFNTAGMQPLVPYLSGLPHPLGKRIVNVQKCLRTVDFENIGDHTHHTFFQMLGNWSLGDYFKKEAIEWSFEFLTDKAWLNIPLKKLGFTVFEGNTDVPRDQESYQMWKNLSVPEKRIAFVGKDNFWIAGDSGPCGPSTEMFYWTGAGEAPVVFDVKDNRWVEIWNDVFMAYYKDEKGRITPLTQKNVDTGMGLERTLAVLNGKKSAYETDLFQPIIKKIEQLSKASYAQKTREMRIIADHLRAAVFILGDENGVVPSNVDRGYILRRLIRRAIRYGRLVGLPEIAFPPVAEVIIKEYSPLYPELATNKAKILSELQKEEEKFHRTLEKGLREFDLIMEQIKKPIKVYDKAMAPMKNAMDQTDSIKKVIDGVSAFRLFQSYGFPIEITEELAAERGMHIDREKFDQEFAHHQELSRAGAEKKFKGGLADTSMETTRLHTVNHILNEALRKVISKDIHQRGSNITPERLRFDFGFDRKLTPEEVKKVEDEVNRVIKKDLPVIRKEMSKAEALKLGAEMEFGQKYPEKVSVYFVGDYSKEFCGGPHVTHTKEIGHFKIIKEEAVAAGVRRIKAVVE